MAVFISTNTNFFQQKAALCLGDNFFVGRLWSFLRARLEYVVSRYDDRWRGFVLHSLKKNLRSGRQIR
jgi:hypothetical protein